MNYLLLLLSLTLLIINGCKVGPNYHRPCTILPKNFIEDKPAKMIPINDDSLVHWWECVFHDPFLNQLLEETLSCNFDLRIAIQRIYQARANYSIRFASIFPEFGASARASRFRSSQTVGSTFPLANTSPIQNLFAVGLDAIWQVDLFGKLRRDAQSAYYAWEASMEDERGVKIMVLSEVANLYIVICYLQTKIGLAKQLIALDKELLSMSDNRFKAGVEGLEGSLQDQSVLESSKAALDVLEISLKQNIYALAVLLGRIPETLVDDFAINRPIPIVYGKIPETLPSDLLRRRPDIASAERTLASQTELIGVAVADLFPSVSLIGSSGSFGSTISGGPNVGFASSKLNRLFTSASSTWALGGLVSWPIFDFGKRWATVDIQKFITNQAYLTYEKTVINALQEVEAALATYFKEEERLGHLSKQADADKRFMNVISDQFQSGLVNYTLLLQSKVKWLISANVLVDSQLSLNSDLIAIYTALGGDW